LLLETDSSSSASLEAGKLEAMALSGLQAFRLPSHFTGTCFEMLPETGIRDMQTPLVCRQRATYN
jgi:hypothetical protein